jgi:hypothetical protein
MTIEIKPTAFARGVPKEQNNGFFGVEEQLLAMPIGTQVTAVVTFSLEDDITKLGHGVRYPVIAMDHIEPLWDEALVAAARESQATAYKKRTGANELDFSTIGATSDEAGE